VGFVVDRMVLGQVSLRVLQFSPVNITPSWLSILVYHPVFGGRSSETEYHPMDMNSKNYRPECDRGQRNCPAFLNMVPIFLYSKRGSSRFLPNDGNDVHNNKASQPQRSRHKLFIF
jgi:hypothetical protein